jgi:hypothetical protein
MSPPYGGIGAFLQMTVISYDTILPFGLQVQFVFFNIPSDFLLPKAAADLYSRRSRHFASRIGVPDIPIFLYPWPHKQIPMEPITLLVLDILPRHPLPLRASL